MERLLPYQWNIRTLPENSIISDKCEYCGGKGGWLVNAPMEAEEYEGCRACYGTGKAPEQNK